MLQQNKAKLLLTSLITLLPMLLALCGWPNSAWLVFGMPLLLLATHWLVLAIAFADPRNRQQSQKALGLVFWVCPLTSLGMGAMLCAAFAGWLQGLSAALFFLTGLLFVGIGNYLPKCRPNRTIGIRVVWTLQDEENWIATHRFGGRVWVVGGLLLMLWVFLPQSVAYIAFILLLTLLTAAPIVYSWRYYRRQRKAGKVPASAAMSAKDRRSTALALAFTMVIGAFVVWMLFSGNIALRYDETSFTIEASYWSDRTVPYADIEFIEYRSQDAPGVRVNGFASPRLLMGTFQNEEFGSYTRYSYTRCDACVVLTVRGGTLVLSGSDEAATKAIYEELLTRKAPLSFSGV